MQCLVFPFPILFLLFMIFHTREFSFLCEKLISNVNMCNTKADDDLKFVLFVKSTKVGVYLHLCGHPIFTYTSTKSPMYNDPHILVLRFQ